VEKISTYVSKVDLKIDWATHQAAEYACKHWHYSKCMPCFGTVKIGVWENRVFIGVVIFSRGANKNIGSPYNLEQTQVCELTRIALKRHITPVSRIIRISLSFLKKTNPKIKLVVSYADKEQGHHGGIYQATNWIYCGEASSFAYRVLGKTEHPKTLHSRYGTGGQSLPWLKKEIDPNASVIKGLIKYRYLMPLDKEMRDQVESLRQPYPKRQKRHALGHHPGSGRVSTDLGAPITEAQNDNRS